MRVHPSPASPSARPGRVSAWAALGLLVLPLVLLALGCEDNGTGPRDGTNGSGDEQLFGDNVPGDVWVRFVALEGPVRGMDGHVEGLVIRPDGRAVASPPGMGPSRLVQLSPDTMRVIAGWFTDAGFARLEDRYLSERLKERRFEIALREDGSLKRVLAQPSVAPAALRILIGRLDDLTWRILSGPPPGPPKVHGEIAVTPAEADTGVARTIRLTLTNSSADSVTLRFPTTQLYDFILAGPQHVPGMGDGGMGDGGMGDGGMGGMGDGGMGGMGGSPGLPPEMVVWNWARGRDFPPTPTSLVFAPGEVKSFEETWDGRDNSGLVVLPGHYKMVAAIPADQPVPVRGAEVAVSRVPPAPPHLAAVASTDPAQGPPGTSRSLTLAVTNLGPDTVVVRFASSQRFDFALFRARPMGPGMMDGGWPPRPDPIWLWSAGQQFDPAPGTESWAPGETKTFTATWDGKDLGGADVPPGEYALAGALWGRPFARSRPVTVLVTPQ